MTDIYKKLAEIQKTLNAPKNQYSEFGGYNYRSCEDIIEAVKPLMGDYVLLESDKIIHLGDRYYVESTATMTDGKESISVTASARETDTRPKMDAAQLTGSASSYARKYALSGLFAINDTKDPDSMDNSKHTDVGVNTSHLASMYEITSTLELMEKLQRINDDESRTQAIAEVIEGLKLAKAGKKQLTRPEVSKIQAGAMKRIADIQGEIL